MSRLDELGPEIVKRLATVTPAITSGTTAHHSSLILPVDALLSKQSNILANDLGISPRVN
jgi:hypothetical protein